MEAATVWEFRLARLLHMTVGELRGRMSAGEFTEWILFLAAETEIQKRA
jgi:hypothetical protein